MRLMAGPGINQLVGQYVSEKIGVDLTVTPFTGFAVFDEQGNLCAGIIVGNFRGSDCEISIAAETARWAKKGICQRIFEYVFYKMGCVRCTSIIQNVRSTKRARRFAEGCGFVLEGKLRLAYDGKTDALVYGLLRRDCKFLRENQGGKGGEEIRAKAAASAGPVQDSGRASADECRDSDSAS